MKLKKSLSVARVFLKTYKPTMLTGFAVSTSAGAFVMGILAGSRIEKNLKDNPDMSTKDKAIMIAKETGIAAAVEAMSVAATVASNNSSRHKIASLGGYALLLQDKIKAMESEQDKIETPETGETFREFQERKTAIEQSKAITLVGQGEKLYFDPWFNNTFPCTAEDLARAQYAFAGKLDEDLVVSYLDFYKFLGKDQYLSSDTRAVAETIGWTYPQVVQTIGDKYPFSVRKLYDADYMATEMNVLRLAEGCEPKLLYDSDGEVIDEILEETYYAGKYD